MQCLCVAEKVARGIDVSTRSPAWLVMLEIFFGNGFKGMHRCSLGLGLGRGWVFAKPDAGHFADGIDIGFASHAKAHAELLCAKLILIDECPRAPFADAQTEARQLIIKENSLALAGQLCRRDRRRGKLHASPPTTFPAIWEGYGKVCCDRVIARRTISLSTNSTNSVGVAGSGQIFFTE